MTVDTDDEFVLGDADCEFERLVDFERKWSRILGDFMSRPDKVLLKNSYES